MRRVVLGIFGLSALGCPAPDPEGEPYRPPGEDGDTESGGETGDPPSTVSQSESGPDSTDSGVDPVCDPGDAQECLCDDGLHLGTQVCDDDGLGWGACVCDGDEGTTSGTSDPDTGVESTGDEPEENEVCFLGPDRDNSVCLPLHVPDSPPDGYAYPPPLGGDANYREPIAYLDLEAIDPATMLAPNFRLDEIAQAFKGRWGVVQPHAVERLQDLRDAVGGIGVNSGYRSPDYNAGVGGATNSRHMFGDGFDLDPSAVSINALEQECVDVGGMLVEYDSHVHCDFRFDPVDVGFFGAPSFDAAPVALEVSAVIEHDSGVFTAPAFGFDEGEPARRWTAYDAAGDVLLKARTPVFIAPPGTARVTVDVGRRVVVEVVL